MALADSARRPSANGDDHGPVPPAALLVAANPNAAYLQGRAEFDSVFGDLAKGKRSWQLTAFGALAVAGVLAVGLVMLATTSRITPYVVEVDRLGRAQAFGPAERLRATDQRLLTAQLAGFVRDIRTVVADPAAEADLVRRSYAFVDQDAAAFLNAYFAAPANDPRLLGRDLTRLVEITSVLPVPSATNGLPGQRTTWKVSWTETSIPRTAGDLASSAAWEGYFTARVVPPTTTERLTVNPLGLYVSTINWTQLATQPDSLATAGPTEQPGGPLSSMTTAGSSSLAQE
jgi:type IV secretion system protein VirB5